MVNVRFRLNRRTSIDSWEDILHSFIFDGFVETITDRVSALTWRVSCTGMDQIDCAEYFADEPCTRYGVGVV
jgi:hypothetical protein